MGREKKEIGTAGEAIAKRFVQAKGYRIRHANFRTPFGELDIVATDRGSVVFIEVRSRLSSSLGPPILSIDWRKQMHLIKNSLFYLKRYGLTEKNWRIDVISIKLDRDRKPEFIEHLENAVEG